MIANTLALLSMIPAAVVGVACGDFFQFVYKPHRDTVFRELQNRGWLTGLSVVLLGASSLFYFVSGAGAPIVLLGSAGIDFFLLVSGLVMAPHLFFPKLTDPDWISAEQADSSLEGEDLVLGLEVKGRARAYPLDWTFRPHFVEDSVKGEEVTMSYCGLSDLAVACQGNQEGKHMDLEMPIQYENNMMMYDSCTGGLIQQAEATMRNVDGTQVPLKQYPTRIMTREAWRELYPQSEVLHNPPSGLWDRLVRYVVGEWFMRPSGESKIRSFPRSMKSIPDFKPSSRSWG